MRVREFLRKGMGRLASRRLTGLALCLAFVWGLCPVAPVTPAEADGMVREVVVKRKDGSSVRRARLPRRRAAGKTAAAKGTPRVFAGGQGTAKSPWTIRTAAQLQAFSNSVNSGQNYAGRYIRLDSDVNLWNTSWAPIGMSRDGKTLAFSGTFNGNGRTVRGLTVDRPGGLPVGLFGVLSGATILNLNVEDANVKGSAGVGALAGSAVKTTFRGCSASGSVSGERDVGGLVGSAVECRLDRAGFQGNVAGFGVSTGGAVGGAFGSTLQNISVQGNVAGQENVGGLAGTFQAGLLQNGSVNATVVNGDRNVGGVAGATAGPVTLSHVAFDGNIEGEDNVGGILGTQEQGAVRDASVKGYVMGMNQVGGAAGQWLGGTALRCVSAANVNGRLNVGGVVGRLAGGTLERCASDGEVQGGDAVGGLVGRQEGGSFQNCQPSGMVRGALNQGREVGATGARAINL